jgi:SAM-dependent methyltransferase
MTTPNPYRGAYPWLAGRRGVWREIAAYVAKDAHGVRSLLELGPGYCDFINAFPASRKVAFELNPEMLPLADPDVDFHCGDCRGLPGIEAQSLDLVFASNFLEHFSIAEAGQLLRDIHRALVPGGKLVLLQPNFRLCSAHYWDDPTHRTAFDDNNIGGYLAATGFRVVKLVAGLLPFSMKSRLPKIPLLVRAYLRSPFKPSAAQMYVVAERS